MKLRRKITEKRYAKEKDRVLQKLAALTLFEQSTDKGQRTQRAANDFWYFCKEYLPHYFSSATQAEFHPQISDAAEVTNKVVAIAAPRGYSKSTIMSFAHPIWKIVFQKKKFIVLAMENEQKAEMQTWRILLELQLNPRILNDFGAIVLRDAARADFQTLVTPDRPFSTRMLALGAGMSARGLINAQFRPDHFICDDLENRQLARNPRRVEHMTDIVLGDYVNCMCAGVWSFLVIGTVICKGSVLYNLLRNKAVHALRFQARIVEENGARRSTWPEVHTLEALDELERLIGTVRFQAEKQNDPIEVDGVFKETWFRRWRSLPDDIDLSQLVIVVDLSYSDVGDNKAMFPMVAHNHSEKTKSLGKWRDAQGKLFGLERYKIVLECFNRKCSLDEAILTIYEWNRKYRPRKIRIDGTYSQKVIFKREFARYAMTYGTLPIEYVELRENKEERILRLESELQRGILLLPASDDPDTEETVRQFTRFKEPGVNDDGPDAISAGSEYTDSLLRKKGSVTC